jgi:glycosyltransferase involved in cell wall biosynthesis
VIAQSLDIDKEQMDGKVHVHRVAHKTIFPFKGPFKEFILRLEYGQSVNKRLKEIIEKYKIDIIEVPNFSAEGFVHSLFKKIPLVSRLHTHFSEVIQFCQWPKTLDRKLSCLLEDYTILRSDLVTCSTHRHKDIVFDEVGANSKNIEIIPLGIPLPVLTESHFKANNPATILFVGRLERRKGAHILFKSIPYILKEFPDTKFLIIGRDTYVNEDFVSFDGKKEDSFKDKLIKSIPGKCLKNINFLDHVDNKELSRYYSCCDIFVAPSLYESFGFIYIEAMSHAKPVVGCGVGGVPEVVKDGEAGILVPPGDHISLGRAVIRLLKDTEYRLDMGAKARLHVEKNFTRDLMIERTLAAYKKALKRE